MTAATGPVPSDSMFIYRPDRRHEIWRFVLYMVLHAGWFHLGFNVAVQLLFGLPLEMVHGSTRIACIYFSGVLAGSLGTSIFDPEVYLVGASGGVYALLAAHLANVLLNYHQMRYGVVRLAFILIFGKDCGGFSVDLSLYFPLPYSLLRLWLCHLCTLRRRGCAACPGGCQLGSGFICCPPGWRCGWTHHWTARVEELRAEAARAAALVDRTGHLHGPGGLRCGLQYTQRGDPLQYARGEDTLH